LWINCVSCAPPFCAWSGLSRALFFNRFLDPAQWTSSVFREVHFSFGLCLRCNLLFSLISLSSRFFPPPPRGPPHGGVARLFSPLLRNFAPCATPFTFEEVPDRKTRLLVSSHSFSFFFRRPSRDGFPFPLRSSQTRSLFDALLSLIPLFLARLAVRPSSLVPTPFLSGLRRQVTCVRRTTPCQPFFPFSDAFFLVELRPGLTISGLLLPLERVEPLFCRTLPPL